ncbi:MAG TPA: STAS domain-containing protein [Pseudonocardiaceae bacterium]
MADEPKDVTADELLDLDERWQGDLAVLSVGGEVDMLSTPLLEERLRTVFAAGPSVVVLDLLGVRYLGSSGLAVLVGCRDAAGREGVDLRLVCAGESVLRPLTATALDELFDIYPEVEPALAGRD